ncbi:hypothetical protein [Sediminibacterium sp.]|uniref:hypothetical protein n=1 Tax=Sediminibacterium sp. TaxID=1917865 RepID=UPI002727A045|nr:hypothetical protein [Sediminibacterium sp.]MDO8995652.1 hypothetical protein [Sediminibacterium sp.]MDP2419844.1 hypothetical protein [Sediminibacterium sp.]
MHLSVELSIFISCNNKDKLFQIDKSFEVIYVTKNKIPIEFAKGVHLDSFGIKYIKMLGLADTIAVVIEDSARPRIRYFDLIGEKELGSFISDKSNSMTLVNPIYFNQFYYRKGRLFYNLIDLKKNYILNIDLGKSMLDSNYQFDSKRFLPYNLVLKFNSLFITNDSSYIGTYRGNRDVKKNIGGKLFLYNILTNELNFSSYYPEVSHERLMQKNEYPNYYYNYSCFNENKQILASFNKLFHQVDFVDLRNKKQLSVINNEKYFPPNIDSAFPIKLSTQEFYYSVFAGEKYAYGLCLNGPHKRFIEDSGGTELHLYEWDGTFKKIIKLDKSRLISFFVIEKSGLLFATHYSEKFGYSIIKYNIGIN